MKIFVIKNLYAKNLIKTHFIVACFTQVQNKVINRIYFIKICNFITNFSTNN
jgi:hypothetical protein